MWTCPECGEANEDAFPQCWKCVSDMVRRGRAPRSEEAPPRPLRSWGSILARAAAAFVLSAVGGLALFHRNGAPLDEAAVSSLILGLVVGGMVGVVLWVAFPYRSLPSTEAHEPPAE